MPSTSRSTDPDDSESETSASETDSSIAYADSSDNDDDIFDLEIIEGDFVIVRVQGKSRAVNYIARIDAIDDIEYEGVFLKKVHGKNQENQIFIIDEEDEALFMKEDIVTKLPLPNFRGGSDRQKDQMSFGIDLSTWNIAC